MSNGDLHWIANYIWGIADDVLRDLYVRGKYRDVILPMTVLRRLDAVLVDSKPNVLEMKAVLDQTGVVEQDSALRQAAGQAFYNTSKFTLRDLRAPASRQQLRADFEAYVEEVPQAQRIGGPPRNRTFRLQALEVAEQQHPEVAARRQARPTDPVAIELGALLLDEGVEARRIENTIQAFVKRMARAARQVRTWTPTSTAAARDGGACPLPRKEV